MKSEQWHANRQPLQKATFPLADNHLSGEIKQMGVDIPKNIYF